VTDNGRILIGKVSGCFGVKGWLKVFSYSNPRENITSYGTWIVNDVVYKSVESKKNGKLIVAKLNGIDDKDLALTMIGQKIEIEKEQLHELDNDQYYWHDLVGLEVTNKQGVNFGTIKSLLETGAHDVVIINGDRERIVPYIMHQTIIDVNLEKNSMLVDWHEDD